MQVKSADVKAVLGVLQVAKSKTLKTWHELDRRITDTANEAKDNARIGIGVGEDELDELGGEEEVNGR